MNKKAILAIIAITVNLYSFAQNILPNENTEFCPLTNITFTVTLPRIANNTTPFVASSTNSPTVVSGTSNLSHTATQTTFKFTGKFRDVNIAQTFKIDYTPNGGTATSYYVTFKRIKSLFYGACGPILPAQASITAPACQITNHTVSFANLKWKTEFESPALCFGSITTYEYLLPANWVLNGITSDGATWIAGDNNETVTSDLMTGGTILIRVVNSCGASFTKSSPVGIPITRSKPSLTFTAPQFVCNTSTFTTTNAPTWVNSFTWQVTPSNLVSITQGNPATFTKINNGLGDVKLTIGSSGCGSYEYQTFEIIGTYQLTIGTPAATGITGFSPSIGVSPGEVLDLEAAEDYQPTYNWNINGGTIIGNATTQRITVVVDNPCNGSVENGYFNASVSYTNPCGTGASYSANTYIVCGTGGPMFTISPNPATDNITINGRQKNKVVQEIQVIDKFGVVKKVVRHSSKQKNTVFSISDLPRGIYFIKIFDGKNWESKQLLKK